MTVNLKSINLMPFDNQEEGHQTNFKGQLGDNLKPFKSNHLIVQTILPVTGCLLYLSDSGCIISIVVNNRVVS